MQQACIRGFLLFRSRLGAMIARRIWINLKADTAVSAFEIHDNSLAQSNSSPGSVFEEEYSS